MQDPSNAAADPVVQRLFGVGLHTRLVCEESGEAIEEDATAYELKCNITGEVNHLAEGVRLGLQDDREKNSEALGRLALFKVRARPLHACMRNVRGSRAAPCMGLEVVQLVLRVGAQGSSAVSRLPPYLTAQMVRFFYKVDVRQKAKILRKARAPAEPPLHHTLLPS